MLPLVDMIVLLISGLLISEVLLPNIRLFTNINWLPLHIGTASLAILIVGSHVGLPFFILNH